MNPLSATSLSGMRTAQAALDVSAHNIANLATPGFRRQQALATDDSGGGVAVALRQASQPGSAIEADMVDQLVAKNNFLANLAVFKTSDRLMGTLLDTAG